MTTWAELPNLVVHKIMDNLDEKTRCSVATLICKDWNKAEREQDPRWSTYKIDLPKPLKHLLFFKRLVQGGHLQSLEIKLPDPYKASVIDDYFGHYISLAGGSGIQELILIDFVRAEDLKLLDLLPKLTRLRIDVLSRRRDNDAVYYCEELLNSLTQLSLGRITDMKLRLMKSLSEPVMIPGYAHGSNQRICASFRTATSLKSLELLQPGSRNAPIETMTELRNLRSLATTEWVHSDLNHTNLTNLANLTRLELWSSKAENLDSVATLPTLKELKLRMKDDISLEKVKPAWNPQLTSLDIGLAGSPRKQVKKFGSRAIPAFMKSLVKVFPRLVRLHLSNLGLQSLSTTFLSFLPEVTHLSLADNEFRRVPTNLHLLMDLKELDVKNNPIIFNDSDLASLASLSALKTLIVGAPHGLKSVYQESWTAFYQVGVEKIKTLDPRLYVKDCSPKFPLGSLEVFSEESDNDTEESDA